MIQSTFFSAGCLYNANTIHHVHMESMFLVLHPAVPPASPINGVKCWDKHTSSVTRYGAEEFSEMLCFSK